MEVIIVNRLRYSQGSVDAEKMEGPLAIFNPVVYSNGNQLLVVKFQDTSIVKYTSHDNKRLLCANRSSILALNCYVNDHLSECYFKRYFAWFDKHLFIASGYPKNYGALIKLRCCQTFGFSLEGSLTEPIVVDSRPGRQRIDGGRVVAGKSENATALKKYLKRNDKIFIANGENAYYYPIHDLSVFDGDNLVDLEIKSYSRLRLKAAGSGNGEDGFEDHNAHSLTLEIEELERKIWIEDAVAQSSTKKVCCV